MLLIQWYKINPSLYGGHVNGGSASIFKKTSSVQGGNSNNSITNAVNNAVNTMMQSIQKDSRIAIINVSSDDKEIPEFVAGELEFIFVNNGFFIVDRGQLDKIRQEQNFQLSGDVDDNTAVSIGKFTGAGVVGTISGTGDLRRLRLRALDTQTARVVGSTSEPF